MTDRKKPSRRPMFFEMLDAFECELLKEALEESHGNHAEAARALGLSLTAFELKVERHALTPKVRPATLTTGAKW